jgi:hypothetical protein
MIISYPVPNSGFKGSEDSRSSSSPPSSSTVGCLAEDPADDGSPFGEE